MTEEAARHQATGATPPPAAPPGEPPPPWGAGGVPPSGDSGFTSRYGLVRPHDGRYLAGVCAAIGRATNTDPVLWRVLLAVLGFFGGIGILVYVSAWLIIPGEGDTASPVESMLGRGRSSMSPVTVIMLSILVAVIFAFIVTDAFRAVLLGAAILISGALLLNRERPGRPGPTEPPTDPVPPVSYPAPTGAPATGPATETPPADTRPPGGARDAFAPHGPYALPTPPPAPPAPRPARKRPRERSALGGVTFSLLFLVLGLLAVLDLTGVLSPGASGYFAAVLATIGLGLLVGTWFGRARWLIALGLVTAAALGVATVAESDDRFRGVNQAVTWAPTSHAELASQYENTVGNSLLDLRSVDFTERHTEITVAVTAGEAIVVLPPNVDATVTATVNVGEAVVFDHRHSKRGGATGSQRESTDLGADGPGGGTLHLLVHVDVGRLEVTR
ncbi:PspC domain-containing protein [Salinispora tropica]|uniref:PspC domain protein n=1 Tax=Salinispora tropica (strain ATCC BAA-916 / DSM 44818 / JCM 13857 / NBRC 105044 / CNB-440) TaxID=369723 RepID=A4XBF8_SALTO|nr:PspC domain-containing protein [Salinispora tropica]ABP56257.1 PspC domain protein [Salinispora tropica CNB-440]